MNFQCLQLKIEVEAMMCCCGQSTILTVNRFVLKIIPALIHGNFIVQSRTNQENGKFGLIATHSDLIN